MPRRFIGVAKIDKSLDHSDHLRDFLRCVGRDVGRSDSKCSHVLEVVAFESLRDHRGVDAFRGLYRLRELRAQTAPAWAQMDVLAVPTVPTTFTVAEMLADPIHRNTVLGTYTTFTNLLDLAAVALPAGRTRTGRPHGITLLAPAGRDAWLAGLAAELEPVLRDETAD